MKTAGMTRAERKSALELEVAALDRLQQSYDLALIDLRQGVKGAKQRVEDYRRQLVRKQDLVSALLPSGQDWGLVG